MQSGISGSSEIITVFSIASGGIALMLFAVLTLLIIKDKKRVHYLHAAIFFIVGFCIICDTYYRQGTESITAPLLYMNYPFIYLLGPVFYFYFRSILNGREKFSKTDLLFLIPFAVVLILFIPYYLQPSAAKLMTFPLWEHADGVFLRVFELTEYLMFFWNCFCFVLVMKQLYILMYDKEKIEEKIKTMMVYLGLWLAATIAYTFSDLLSLWTLYRITTLIEVLFFLVFAVLSLRYPNFFLVVQKEASVCRYAKSQLGSLNVAAVIERIEDLLELEKMYLDEELSVQSLSDLLNISSQQLSEIINTEYGQNFNTYINSYRIEAAKELIANNPDERILAVAFNCGFKSKTTFNIAFLKGTGMTPTEYRKQVSFKKIS